MERELDEKKSFQRGNATSVTSKLASMLCHAEHFLPGTSFCIPIPMVLFARQFTERRGIFSLAFKSFSMQDKKARAGWFVSTDTPNLPSQAFFVFPLVSQGKKEAWLERQNEPLKEAEGHSEPVTHNCLLLASWKMPLKAERRNHFAGSKGKDSPATFSYSFFNLSPSNEF